MSLSANTIMVKLTIRYQSSRLITSSTDKHYSLDSDHEDDCLHWLSKRQSPTTVLFRTTLNRTITQHELLMLLRSIHFLWLHLILVV